MTEIKSNTIQINSTAESIYHFLTDFNNFEKLMPDQVINWKTTGDSCSFTIKGMAGLALKMDQLTKPSHGVYKSEDPSPFNFQLGFEVNGAGNHSDVQCTLSASLNPMLKMMASRPLQNFVNLLVEKLKELFEFEVKM